jgi:hypothetical protein
MAIAGARIRFPGNPWPKGHGVAAAAWTAALSAEGLRFHLHLRSEDYDADDDRDDAREPASDWKARIVWNNYHACTLSSTQWGHPGFLVATPGTPIDLEKLAGKTLRVDRVDGDELPAELDHDDFAFGIYLLGHDSVADHRIRFVKRRGPATYDVHWRARVALTYAGDTALAHRLEATLPKLRLGAIAIADEALDGKAARELLGEVVVGAKRFRMRKRAFVR